ncbi:MAG: RNase adaptor protein RapZ [Betaproteobacteria bacterium TMED41]|nr:MAG: RNase adaptor protein RapZ [Betaproteobacteria bacterium TMED41]|tara:strand:- start:532 stop:1416 length:885 start_codon:yes stop_codon:yes gene_type:complete
MKKKVMSNLEIFVVTGMSGSGKSVVLRILEDAGFFCVDNLPISLLDSLLELLSKQNRNQIAIAIDAREIKSLETLVPKLNSLKKKITNLIPIFLNASNEDLIKRYSETRRRHPFSFQTNEYSEEKMAPTLHECIESERLMLKQIENIGMNIDTTGLKPSDLKHRIRELIKLNPKTSLVIIQSFAYRKGIPADSDLVFDARCLPNPFYETNLKELTGKDNQVEKYFKNQKQVSELVFTILQFLENWLPLYLHKERSYFCISIGCTGGRHRSVFCVENIAKKLKQNWTTSVRHRDL